MYTQTLIEQEHLGFPINDRIFLGEGLFETIKVVDAQPCFADLHWQRLSRSADQLRIPFSLPYDQWLSSLIKKIQDDKLFQGGIKAILSGGCAERGLVQFAQCNQLVLQTFSYHAATRPLRLVRVPWLRDASNPIYQIKSINYLEAICARRQALAAGADDAIFFNNKGHATETTCANLFLIQEGCLLTPPLIDGLIAGITRSRVLAFAKQHRIKYLEVSLEEKIFARAEAAFITNSLQGIQSVQCLEHVNFDVAHPLIMHLKSSLHI